LASLRQHYLVAMATSLTTSKNKVQIYYLHKVLSYDVKTAKIDPVDPEIFDNIRQFFGRVVPDVHELSHLWSYWTEFHEIFTPYTGITCAVNSHFEVAISHSVSKCQSDKTGKFAIFFTESVAIATSLEISEKEVQIVHLHRKCFHSVKRLRKRFSGYWDNCSLINH